MNLPFTRRAGIIAALALTGWPAARAAIGQRPLEFPRDFGAHRDARTEWWYITGHASQGTRRFGFQITFFRSRVGTAQALESRFAARHLVFAHAAVTDLAGGRLLHDQRIARWSGRPTADDGFGTAFAADADTDLRIGTGPQAWSLRRLRDGYRARAVADHFSLDIDLIAQQPVLLQGQAGISQKGPRPEQNSHYYSLPQLRARGGIGIDGQRVAFDTPTREGNAAWLDHEWSDEILPPEAVGWDWSGINGFDGAALTVFRLRRADGSALWAGGSWRASADAPVRVFAADEVRFEPLRRWTSPRTGGVYPLEWRIDTPAGRFSLHALLDDQELDSRASTGAIYWEGLSELRDAAGKPVGRGYLELTGYRSALRL
ncbi:carotenoid 1,2-hydratase [Xylophilus sp. GOD-11R]|nr:carotenoid 1,2-hydratase [Xylophilus sp. GOD-11R]WPB58154.1 carotenoid 1,2-hydratase [Xylophilus sp. GOD-11R]